MDAPQIRHAADEAVGPDAPLAGQPGRRLQGADVADPSGRAVQPAGDAPGQLGRIGTGFQIPAVLQLAGLDVLGVRLRIDDQDAARQIAAVVLGGEIGGGQLPLAGAGAGVSPRIPGDQHARLSQPLDDGLGRDRREAGRRTAPPSQRVSTKRSAKPAAAAMERSPSVASVPDRALPSQTTAASLRHGPSGALSARATASRTMAALAAA
ncbi:hypothetical protein COLO4_02299 [Corchorus olitorius]|uniref:Uncharacterized protein n=1 Tax=Corchorus olitorius TaxID=93759 RepID=A0A1R3L186_9ROSI|nr:hypothetical protein COLO4_02299 [Corchorus olitorius]